MSSIYKYKLAFILGFVLIPSMIWAFEVSPTLRSRQAYVSRQENAVSVQKANSLLPTQRDELQAMWGEFKPVANAALSDIGNDLNPHLVQKRMNDLAAATGCKIVIQPVSQQDGDYAMRFNIAGDGSFQSLVNFVDQLEQGQHFVRFEKLTFGFPDRTREIVDHRVRLTAVAMIPLMPDGVAVETETQR